MTIRQAKFLTATVLKFGDQMQIEALRVLALGAEIGLWISENEDEITCPLCNGKGGTHCNECGRGDRCRRCRDRGYVEKYEDAEKALPDTEEEELLKLLMELKKERK